MFFFFLRDHITSSCCGCLLAVVSIVTAFRLFFLLFIIPFFLSANDHEKKADFFNADSNTKQQVVLEGRVGN